MHNAVICTEDAPRLITTEQRQAAQDTYLGSELLDALSSNCEPWPGGIIDDDLKEPFVSSIPTLILSGEADPITPPAYGQLVADQFKNAHHIVNRHQGHMQAPLGCVPNIMAQTISNGGVENLQLSCLERLSAPAFFIDANGPLP
jgi:pimeloyl-ACP methyl ester carboxylesterase